VFVPAAQAKLLFAASPGDSVSPHSNFSSVAESILYSELCSRVRHGVPRLSVSNTSSVIEDCPYVIYNCRWLRFALLFGLSDCCESLQGEAGIALESPVQKTQGFMAQIALLR
jgi:hypothetical protein